MSAPPIDSQLPAEAARALRERYRAAGRQPRKQLGQHFLADLNLARKIVDALGEPGGPVLEIGAGLGALTFLLAERGHRVLAVEVDRQLADELREALAPWPQVQVIQADIRTLDLAHRDFAPPDATGPRLRIVGNLPYNLTSEILIQLLRAADVFSSAVVMIQDDVAERLAAAPGGKSYGSLTVTLGLAFAIELFLRVPRQAFWPAPAVDSAVIRLDPHASRPPDERWIEQVVRAGFGQRRKTLGKALAAGLALERERIESTMRAAGLDPGARAETLSPADFVRLARALRSSSNAGESDA
ncbi:MAG TPA: 16S rRNA (adenine(1518)-N(6)/adenine(1519)-N(6))-dimethyltransferase RsmA [Candidatus Udaeobacter sp.]|nr:16S rRNA (adenine(1518)-N(6)/adenine(1519)-N(6))-dimethyltransferase RsmA [Candidatus Udaeobacter sp.]